MLARFRSAMRHPVTRRGIADGVAMIVKGNQEKAKGTKASTPPRNAEKPNAAQKETGTCDARKESEALISQFIHRITDKSSGGVHNNS